ncbi:MAG: phage portal protein, partial [Henriciella sp.]|nr:phage portal protein [Henriciella sp.]
MKWPWAKPEHKNATSMIALAQLPGARWGRSDPAALMRDGFAGNAVAYRCVRMISEAAASIPLACQNSRVADLLREPSPDEAGRALLERLYADLQITGNA